jgi:hypothetical protein
VGSVDQVLALALDDKELAWLRNWTVVQWWRCKAGSV